jgi:hypothetical protein
MIQNFLEQIAIRSGEITLIEVVENRLARPFAQTLSQGRITRQANHLSGKGVSLNLFYNNSIHIRLNYFVYGPIQRCANAR